MKKVSSYLILLLLVFSLTACDFSLMDDQSEDESSSDSEYRDVTLIDDLQDVESFRSGALEHILEGELNGKGNATGFHYDLLPTKKGQIIEDTETKRNEHGVYEAQVEVEGVEKTSNGGYSSFFPDEWDTQDVVDAINEAYEMKEHLTGNTYEGLTEEGISVQMYLDNNEKIISAFPVYE